MTVFGRWLRSLLDNPQLLLLLGIVLAALLAVTLFSQALAPVIAAIVIAFLLDGPVMWLERRGLSRAPATLLVFVAFLAFIALMLVLFLPPLSGQLAQFFETLPHMIGRLRQGLLTLPAYYPGLVTEAFIRGLLDSAATDLSGLGRDLLGHTLAGLRSVVTIAVYVVLVPVMVFFFLKDKRAILGWVAGFLPRERTLVVGVWREVVARAGDYARGKVYEILIVGTVAYIVFLALGLRFPALLATLTGLSVVIPYVGAAVVTLPVAFVAFFQWGLTAEFLAAVGAYLLLQALDGNLLAPLLFSEVVKLHPVAIILAILVFGSIWGLWGVFFAIPLATLIDAVIKACRHSLTAEYEPARGEDRAV
ncbi:MAG: AI-2E family transporter [Rhodothalassiaceae bacterium]